MLIVLLNWLFIAMSCGIWGFAGYQILRHYTDETAPEAGITDVVLMGMASLTVLCNVFSLWLPIGQTVWSILTAGSLLLLVWNWKAITAYLQLQRAFLRQSNRLVFTYFFLLFAIAIIKTIGPCLIGDEGGYQLPIVRWIETFPVVPGIANIEDRMGLNPAIYITNALFGVAWLYEGGLYDLNGFLFVLIGGSFLFGFGRLLHGESGTMLSSIVQATALVFLYRNYLSSMDADLISLYGMLFFLIGIIRQMEQGRFGSNDWQSIWSLLLLCFLVSSKFSAVLIAPLALWLFYLLLRKKHYTSATLSLGFGSLILLSWMARNYYISGFAVYPLYFVDLFDVDWKVPQALAQGVYSYVSEYAKIGIVRPFNTYVNTLPPLETWFPIWLKVRWPELINKLIFIGLPACMLLGLRLCFIKRQPPQKQFRYLVLLLFLAIALWFFRIPAPRFGWPWILVFMCTVSFLNFEQLLLSRQRLVATGLAILLGISLLRSTVATIRENYGTQKQELINLVEPMLREKVLHFDIRAHWLRPTPTAYGATYSTESLNGIRVLVAPDDFCRDATPPCIPKGYHPRLEARGATVEEGFRIGK